MKAGSIVSDFLGDKGRDGANSPDMYFHFAPAGLLPIESKNVAASVPQ